MANKRNKRNQQNKNRIKTNSQETRGPYGIGGTMGERRRGRAPRSDHKRSITEAGGYPDIITLQQHYDMANRQGVGKNLAYGIVNDTWKDFPVVYDGEEDKARREESPTEFEQAWDELCDRLDIADRLKALDLAQRPMRYGALMFVVKEQAGATTKTPLKSPNIAYLEKINVFHEAQLPVANANQNPGSIDFGMPIDFDVRVNVAGSTNEWETSGYTVDASRVFAFGEGALDGSIYGEPCNEGCFEALMDLRKVRMSAAEGYFQNAANKYAVHMKDGANAADASAIADEIDDFDNESSRSMMLGGGTLSLLQTTLSDPTHPWTIALNECAASHSKPIPIITGQMTGVLASEENIKAWNNVVSDRCNTTGTAMIKGLIETLQARFNFPKPSDKLNVVWRDFNEMTTEQKVDLNKKRAETNKICVDAGMLPVYSTELMQGEAGVPVEDVIPLDNGGDEVEE